MPTYAYECDACGHQFEEYQNITEKPIRKCPSCQRQRVRRLIGAGAAVIFRGNGFYQTDYRSKEYKAKAKSDAAGAAAKSSETKPAEKPAADKKKR